MSRADWPEPYRALYSEAYRVQNHHGDSVTGRRGRPPLTGRTALADNSRDLRPLVEYIRGVMAERPDCHRRGEMKVAYWLRRIILSESEWNRAWELAHAWTPDPTIAAAHDDASCACDGLERAHVWGRTHCRRPNRMDWRPLG